MKLFNVVHLPSGYIALRSVPFAAALSAAQEYNTGRRVPAYQVQPAGVKK